MARPESDHDDDGFGEASRYTAHLDRGWSLLDRGDFQRARGSANQALKLRPDIPDAAMLMAAICTADADPEGSLEWYERAIEADAEYVDAQLAAAQVLLYDLDQPERAIARASQARDLDEATLADLIDFALIETEALISLDDRGAAAGRLGELSELDALEELLDPETEREQFVRLLRRFAGEMLDFEPEDIEHLMGRVISLAVRVARAWLDVGAADRALPWLEGLVRRFGDDADIWYLCNEAAYLAGQPVRAAHAALQVLQLDARAPAPAQAPDPTDLHAKIVELLLNCHDPQLRALAREPSFVVIVNDAPPFELVLEGVDPRARALALAARSAREGDSQLTLTGLAVYRRNLGRFIRDPLGIDAELAFAVFDELAVFFGFDDGRRQQLGLPPSEWPPPTDARGHGEHGSARARELDASVRTQPPVSPPEEAPPSKRKASGPKPSGRKATKANGATGRKAAGTGRKAAGTGRKPTKAEPKQKQKPAQKPAKPSKKTKRKSAKPKLDVKPIDPVADSPDLDRKRDEPIED